MNRFRSLALAGALVAAAASAQTASAQVETGTSTASAQQQGADRPSRRAPRARQDVITRAELEASNTSNLYEAIERLRPQWLRPRGGTNFSGSAGTALVVYQGNTQMGEAEALRAVNIEFAEEVRFLDGSEASNTLPGLGSRSVAGAIVIKRPGTR